MVNTMCRWCMLLLRVSRLWSILSRCLSFLAVLCCYTCTQQQHCLRPELAQYPSSKVKPSHVTLSNSSNLCFRNFLCQRWFLFAYQPQKDFPSLSLFSCPLNPCKVLAAVTSPGKEFLSFLSQLHGELLPHVCFPPAICLLHLMPPALCYNGQQTVSSDSPLPGHSWFYGSYCISSGSLLCQVS